MAFIIIGIKNNVNLKELQHAILLHAMKAYATVKLQLHTLTSATDGKSGQLHAPAALLPTERTPDTHCSPYCRSRRSGQEILLLTPPPIPLY